MPSPMMSATVQAAGLSTLSNFLAQFIQAYQEKRAFSLDLIQLLRFVALSFMTAPPNYVWQQYLEKTFPAYPAGRQANVRSDIELKAMEEASRDGEVMPTPAQPVFSYRNTITKWFVDCITMGAIMNTVAFLVLMGIMKGQGTTQIWNNIANETIPIIVAGYKIWPIASIISFSFIPVHRRIVFLSFVGLLWGIYMSLVAARV
ncbi:PXMP2/4 family protein [Paramyrothecium foliicola]|nr:PXMP2/4 family protein [Paramyrothecium foliicola]